MVNAAKSHVNTSTQILICKVAQKDDMYSSLPHLYPVTLTVTTPILLLGVKEKSKESNKNHENIEW